MPLQIAGRRMALATPLFEVGLARSGIADEHVEHRGGTRRRPSLPCHLRGDAVDVLGDRPRILWSDANWRHALLTVHDDGVMRSPA